MTACGSSVEDGRASQRGHRSLVGGFALVVVVGGRGYERLIKGDAFVLDVDHVHELPLFSD